MGNTCDRQNAQHRSRTKSNSFLFRDYIFKNFLFGQRKGKKQSRTRIPQILMRSGVLQPASVICRSARFAVVSIATPSRPFKQAKMRFFRTSLRLESRNKTFPIAFSNIIRWGIRFRPDLHRPPCSDNTKYRILPELHFISGGTKRGSLSSFHRQ